MKDETLLYNPGSVKFCALNPSAAFVWERLEVPRTVAELAHELGAAYHLENATGVEQDLQAVLEQLAGLEFLTHADLPLTATPASIGQEPGLPYVAPRVNLMDESQVLSAFQVTSAGTSWWAV